VAEAPRAGDRVELLELADAWLVDPVTGREGRGSLEVEDGRITAVRWASGRGGSRPDIVVAPSLVDIHAHFRQPGREDAETVATGAAAAAHGGFGAVVLMANTRPPIDSAGILEEVLALGRASGTPVRVLSYATTTAGRAGETLSPMGELADAGARGFSDDGSPVADPALLRNALLYAGALGLPIVEHAEDPALLTGAEMHEGLVATILGLRGWPTAAEEGAVQRDIAILAEAVRAAPPGTRPRLHVTHVSTAAALDHIRRAKAAGLPVTCDVTPHHLAFHDGWVAGDRRWSWEAAAAPWTGGRALAAPYDTATRVNPPLRPPTDALALIAGLSDGTVDAIATDHAPHTQVDKQVEFGDAAPGISGIETAAGIVLALVDAGQVPLARAIHLLTVGPTAVLMPEVDGPRTAAQRRGGRGRGGGRGGGRGRLAAAAGGASGLVPGLAEGATASLVVLDRSDGWTVAAEALRSKGKNTPLLGRSLAGRILMTIVDGRFAYVDAPALG
jgi:dihydroorotase